MRRPKAAVSGKGGKKKEKRKKKKIDTPTYIYVIWRRVNRYIGMNLRTEWRSQDSGPRSHTHKPGTEGEFGCHSRYAG